MPSVLQEKINVPGNTQFPAITFDSNVTYGSLIYAKVSWSAITGSVSTVADTVGTIYKPLFTILQGSGRTIAVYVGYAAASGANTLTFGLNASQNSTSCAVIELSGWSAATDGAVITKVGGTATAPSIGPLTVNKATDIVIACIRGGSLSASTTGWTPQTSGGAGTEYIIPGATGTETASWTQASATYLAALVALIVLQEIKTTGLGSTEADGTPSVSAKATIALTGLGSAEADGTPTVTTKASVALIGRGSGEADGTPSVAPGAVTIALTGLGSAEVDGTPSVNARATIALSGLGSTEADGTPSVVPGAVTIALTGLGSTEVDGTPSVGAGAVSITLIGLGSTEGDGTPSVSPGPITIALIGLGSTLASGTPSVVPGAVSIAMSGLASTEGDGTPSVSARATIALIGLGSTEADGIPSVAPAGRVIVLIGLGSTTGNGIPSVSRSAAHPSFIDLIGIASTEGDGVPSVTPPRNPALSYAMIQYWQALGADGFWGYCLGVCSTPNNPDVPVQQEPIGRYPNGPAWLQRMDNGSLGANFDLGGNNGPWETIPDAPCELDPIVATQANDSYATWQPTPNVP